MDLQILHGNEITPEHLNKAILLDRQVYDAKYIGPAELYYSWYNANADNFTYMFDKETLQISGYINAMPLKPEIFEKYENCSFYAQTHLTDTALDANYILKFDKPGLYNLLVVSVVLAPEYRTITALQCLMAGWAQKLINLSVKNIYINSILGDTVSGSGERICQWMGMQKICETPYETNLYKLNLIPPGFKPVNKKWNELKEIYAKNQSFFC